MEMNMTTDVTTTIEYLNALRKAAGLAIDPKTAKVTSLTVLILDPYDDGLDIPEEAECFGLESFACDPRSEAWVWFGDLPDTTRKALLESPAEPDELSVLSGGDRD
jgi:hypothetical protein